MSQSFFLISFFFFFIPLSSKNHRKRERKKTEKKKRKKKKTRNEERNRRWRLIVTKLFWFCWDFLFFFDFLLDFLFCFVCFVFFLTLDRPITRESPFRSLLFASSFFFLFFFLLPNFCFADFLRSGRKAKVFQVFFCLWLSLFFSSKVSGTRRAKHQNQENGDREGNRKRKKERKKERKTNRDRQTGRGLPKKQNKRTTSVRGGGLSCLTFRRRRPIVHSDRTGSDNRNVFPPLISLLSTHTVHCRSINNNKPTNQPTNRPTDQPTNPLPTPHYHRLRGKPPKWFYWVFFFFISSPSASSTRFRVRSDTAGFFFFFRCFCCCCCRPVFGSRR